MISTPPASNEVEVSVFGPGVGECIVVHLGDGDWLVVDSCIDRRSGKPIALLYLNSIGVDIATQVKMVVASHWHDDHIEGLNEIFDAAKSAVFVNSDAHPLRDLAQLAGLGAKLRQSSATKAYADILDILDSRRGPKTRKQSVGPMGAIADRRLLLLPAAQRTIVAEVYSLSPSDGVVAIARSELSSAMTAVQHNRRPVRQGPNQLCVALWVKVGKLDLLLGADLEQRQAPNEGWNAIVHSTGRPQELACFFKVPHHGSQNAHSDECWSKMLNTKAVAVITPFSKSSLPTPQDVTRIIGLTNSAYLTCDPATFSLAKYPNPVGKQIKQQVIARNPLTGATGQVCFRADALNGTSHSVTLWDGARSL